MAGTWSKADVAALEKVGEEVNDVFKSFGGDAEAALKTLAEFEKKHPKLAGIPYFNAPKIEASAQGQEDRRGTQVRRGHHRQGGEGR